MEEEEEKRYEISFLRRRIRRDYCLLLEEDILMMMICCGDDDDDDRTFCERQECDRTSSHQSKHFITCLVLLIKLHDRLLEIITNLFRKKKPKSRNANKHPNLNPFRHIIATFRLRNHAVPKRFQNPRGFPLPTLMSPSVRMLRISLHFRQKQIDA